MNKTEELIKDARESYIDAIEDIEELSTKVLNSCLLHPFPLNNQSQMRENASVESFINFQLKKISQLDSDVSALADEHCNIQLEKNEITKILLKELHEIQNSCSKDNHQILSVIQKDIDEFKTLIESRIKEGENADKMAKKMLNMFDD